MILKPRWVVQLNPLGLPPVLESSWHPVSRHLFRWMARLKALRFERNYKCPTRVRRA